MKLLNLMSMKLPALALLVCVMLLLTGCLGGRQVAIAHPDVPHRIAQSVWLRVVIEQEDGKHKIGRIWWPAGSYIALPHVVEGSD